MLLVYKNKSDIPYARNFRQECDLKYQKEIFFFLFQNGYCTLLGLFEK